MGAGDLGEGQTVPAAVIYTGHECARQVAFPLAPTLGGLRDSRGTRSGCDGLLSTGDSGSISRHKDPCRSGVPLHWEPGSSPETCSQRLEQEMPATGPLSSPSGTEPGTLRLGSSRSKSPDDGSSAIAFPGGDPRKTRRTG